MAELLHRLGSFAARRAWTVIVAWLVILGIAVGGFLIGFKGLSSSFDIPGTASGEVIAELEDQLPDFSGASGNRRVPFDRRVRPDRRAACRDHGARRIGARTSPTSPT